MTSFTEIPTDGSYQDPRSMVEFDTSAVLAEVDGLKPQTLLVIGQMASGTATADTVYPVVGASDAVKLFGAGSVLADACAVLPSDGTVKVSAIGVAEPGTSAAAAGTIAFTGTATEGRTMIVRVGAQTYRVQVASGDSATVVGDALVAAITADPAALVAAVNTTGSVAITAKGKGAHGNALVLRVLTSTLPAGITQVTTAPTSGSGTPDLAAAIAAMGDVQWDTVASCYNDTASLTALAAELATRDTALNGIGGTAIAALATTVAGAGSALGNFDSKDLSILIYESIAEGADSSPTPPWRVAVGVGYAHALKAARPDKNNKLAVDPGRSRRGITIPGFEPSGVVARFDAEARNTIVKAGGSTYTERAGLAVISRAVTTRSSDKAYVNVTQRYRQHWLRWAAVTRLDATFGASSVADDATEPMAGIPIVRPKDVRGELVALGTFLSAQGIIEELDAYIDAVRAKRSDAPGVIEAQIKPNFTDEFMGVYLLVSFMP